jgi:predicted transcriptional regulator
MPRLPDPTPAQQDLLTAVTAAVAQRDAADRQYVAAIIAAADAGLAVTQIARATGNTYQAVQAVLKNAQRRTSL